MANMWYDKYITKEADGSWNAWDETQTTCLGNFASRQEAVKAIWEYNKSNHKESKLNVTTK